MKKNKILWSSVVICLLLTVVLQTTGPILCFAEEDLRSIDSAEDLISFAKKCSYDAWSRGKTFTLTCDISLEGLDFEPIPYFGGSFDGGGHTIIGLNISGAHSPCGLFGYLEEGAIVKNLNLSGKVAPEGDKDSVGGIVGTNAGKIENCSFDGVVVGKTNVGAIAGKNLISGTISDCKSNGEIIGEVATGGIVGSSNGLVSSCINNAEVNTICVTPTLDLSSIKLSLPLEVSKLIEVDSLVMTDAGGICGYSCGFILGCANFGKVGYNHVGYNVGGIVGRNSGHLANNRNVATILGRKDVGGIVGHMEPDISYDLSDDLLQSLKTELDALGVLIDDFTGSADGDIREISESTDKILALLEEATSSLNLIMNESGELAGDVILEFNRTSEILANVMDQLAKISDDVPGVSDNFAEAFISLEDALRSMVKAGSVGVEAFDDIIAAFNDMAEAFDHINDGVNLIEDGISLLDNALEIEDKEAAKEALVSIATALYDIVGATDSISNALVNIAELIKNTTIDNDAAEHVHEAAEIFTTMSEAVTDIYNNTLVVAENIDIHWSSITLAADEISYALKSLSSAYTAFGETFDYATSGFEKIINGIDHLKDSVMIKDPQKLELSIKEIAGGFDVLLEATEKFSYALSDYSDAIEKIDGIEELDDYTEATTTAMKSIALIGMDASSAIINISSAIPEIIDNVHIDWNEAGEGEGIIVGGAADLADAMIKLGDARIHLDDAITSLEYSATLLYEAVKLNDIKEIQKALENSSAAISRLVESIQALSMLISDIGVTIENAVALGDQLSIEFSALIGSIDSMAEAFAKIGSGIDEICENAELDFNSAEKGLNLIIDGTFEVLKSSENISDSLLHLADALSDIDNAAEYVIDAIDSFADATAKFADGIDLFSSMAEKINDLLNYLAGVDPIQIENPSKEITEEALTMLSALLEIEAEVKKLNSNITNVSLDSIEKIGKIKNHFTNIKDDLIDAIYGLGDNDIVDTDVSIEEISSVTEGRIYHCENLGYIYADYSCGGIVGTIGIEYSLDPEDDLDTEISITEKRHYHLKAVIHNCTNRGYVNAKYDYAGGICGKMDFGLIYDSKSFCTAESQAGDYVGGIAGISAGNILDSYAKCTLSGGKYVGGIIGSGVTESPVGDSSVVSGCYSMVEIKSFSQYGGAIAGINAGLFEANYFVSSALSGIDKISYVGKAEPISYEDLIKKKSLPEEFYSFTLSFVTGGSVLHSETFEMGDSFDSSVFPEIPNVDGYYGYWDITDLTDLTFDTVVTAVYKPYVTTIGSNECRENEKKVFLVQGEFTDKDAITLSQNTASVDNLVLKNGLFIRNELVESWVISIPEDNMDIHKIHYMPQFNRCSIYIMVNDSWIEADQSEFGSYLIFDTSDDLIEIAIVRQTVNILPIAIIGGVVLIAIAIAIILILKKKAKCTSKDIKNEKAIEHK